MRKFLALILLLFILAGVPANAQTKSKNTKTNSTTVVSTAARFGNTDGITAAQLRNYLEFIASAQIRFPLMTTRSGTAQTTMVRERFRFSQSPRRFQKAHSVRAVRFYLSGTQAKKKVCGAANILPIIRPSQSLRSVPNSTLI